MNRIAIVEFARALHSSLEHRVALAVQDPSGYVDAYRDELGLRGVDTPEEELAVLALIGGLIELDSAAEFDWRADPDSVLEEVGRLLALPGALRPPVGLIDSVELEEDGPALEALHRVQARLLGTDFSLRIIDIGSDSYPTVIIRTDAADRLDALADAAGVRWKDATLIS